MYSLIPRRCVIYINAHMSSMPHVIQYAKYRMHNYSSDATEYSSVLTLLWLLQDSDSLKRGKEARNIKNTIEARLSDQLDVQLLNQTRPLNLTSL